MTPALLPVGDDRLFADWLREEWDIFDDREFVITTFTPAQMARSPQTGTPSRMTWDAFVEWLSLPIWTHEKTAGGAFCPADLERNHRTNETTRAVFLLSFDFDGGADVARVAELLAGYRAVVHETFSSTEDDPRCRAFLQPRAPMDVPTYRRTHEICREHFAAVGLTKGLDGAKDPCRACYRPARRPGTGFRFAVTHGTCLDAKRLVAMNPRPERPAMTPVELAQVGDNYLRAALERAAQAVAAAPDGSRHETVCREAYTLARLPLSAEQIEASLLPAAVHAMGEKRRREAERTIRDAVRARKGAA